VKGVGWPFRGGGRTLRIPVWTRQRIRGWRQLSRWRDKAGLLPISRLTPQPTDFMRVSPDWTICE
jgi:hypothetical protein